MNTRNQGSILKLCPLIQLDESIKENDITLGKVGDQIQKKTPKLPKPLNRFTSLFPIFFKLEKDSKISKDSKNGIKLDLTNRLCVS